MYCSAFAAFTSYGFNFLKLSTSRSKKEPLKVASEPNGAYSLQNKTALYLDIFGNTLLRPASQSYLFQKSRVLSEMVTDSSYCKKRASFVELDRLKFKDRDRLDDQFVFWRSAKENFMVSTNSLSVLEKPL